MKVAVLRETRTGERRVAVVPDGVRHLAGHGLDVGVPTGAGLRAGVSDAEYEAAGARIFPDNAAAVDGSGLVLGINPPSHETSATLAAGTVLVSFLDPLGNPGLARRLAERGVTAVSMELVPRITRAQSMDALSSQATVAGYRAALLAASHLPRFLPMFTTAAGTIRPAGALVLGAGVAGLQAIATLRRLGAVVKAFDVRPEVKEQVESLGASFLEAGEEVSAEGEGGYAAELTEDQHERELALIASAIDKADVVITTAMIPGRAAPVLVTRAMLAAMRDGSVVVDLAAEAGGNCEATQLGESVLVSGVTVLGPENLPANLPVHASAMYSKNIVTLVGEMVGPDGGINVDPANDVLGPATLAREGEITNERVRAAVQALSEPPLSNGDRPA